ncbi:MAG: RsmD family RNA methyltransferase [Oligoflexia bacterium]|nr:RsmD family RNA methyltransferase [Oligoflexia bacterium]
MGSEILIWCDKPYDCVNEPQIQTQVEIMKVIGGAFKGIKLETIQDMRVRPTVDHLKKHILRLAISSNPKTVWDLFAGSGGVGIEFLSLGSQVVFVEELKSACSVINLNIGQCLIKKPELRPTTTFQVINQIVADFLTTSASQSLSVDLVFMDPPYDKGLVSKTLSQLISHPAVTPKTTVLVESATDEKFTSPEYLTVISEVYGPKTLTVLRPL